MIDTTFIQLKKNVKNFDVKTAKTKLVLMGDCATQHLATAIKGYSVLNNYPIDVIDIDYNLIDAQILDDTSELYAVNPNFTLIFQCSEKLEQLFYECKNKSQFAEEMYNKIENNWKRINSKIKTKILQFTFIENDNKIFGNYALKTNESFLYQVKKLNILLADGCQSNKNVFLIDLNSIQSEFGKQKFKDSKLYYVAKMPISIELLPEVAKNVVDVISAVGGIVKKCVICDLDNTLWGGVIGDDGLNGIQIGELGVGHAFEELQRWLKSLKERGIILAVCSKNEENNAKEPFEKHPEMVLSLDDISIFVANWEDKSSNIKYIQKTLNIGMDSMVFLDDNPFERNLVKSMIPEITVPDLPEDPALYLDYLKSLNLFETASYSETDQDRTNQYKAEVNRIETERLFESYEDYLNSLEMIATVCEFDEFQTPRIAQLTQRSNQFNLRTVRCTEGDISNYIKDDNYITRYYMLKDKFGDHGLISVLLLKKMDKETLFVENWLMSCRVLKRGMEEFISDSIVQIAKENGFKYVIGEYLQTSKNAMVANLYEKLGFISVGDNLFKVDVNKYVQHKTYIK